MPENRRHPRLRKRLRVSLADESQERQGFTTNLSRSGLSVSASFVFVPGTKLKGKIWLPAGHELDFEAVVQWARQLRGALAMQAQNAMGLRFTVAPAEPYEQYLNDNMRAAAAGLMAAREAASSIIGSRPPATSTQPPPSTPITPPPRTGVPQSKPRTVAPLSQARSTQPLPPLDTSDILSAAIAKLHVGTEGKTSNVVGPDDLSAPADQYHCSIHPTRAAQWIEQAAVRAVAAHLPPRVVTIGVSLQLSISHAPPTSLGVSVVTTATLTDVTPFGRTLTFEARLSDGVREIASGRHIRVLVEPRRPGT